MENKHKLILLVGKSGSGKSTEASILEKKFGLRVLDSYTTRPKRNENEKGHIFVTQEEFDEVRDKLVAYVEYEGYEYGVPKEELFENDVYIIDPEGIEYMMSKMTEEDTDKIDFIITYLNIPEDLQIKRLCERDGDEKALKRYIHDKKAFNRITELSKQDNYHDLPVEDKANKGILANKIYKIYSNAVLQ